MTRAHLLCSFAAAECSAFAWTALARAPQSPASQPATRPPEGNDQTLRPLSPEEIPPNLNFYALDPLYKEIDRADWIERGRVTDWADTTGNRSSRHMLGAAYLDGKTPGVLVVRGTYGLMN